MHAAVDRTRSSHGFISALRKWIRAPLYWLSLSSSVLVLMQGQRRERVASGAARSNHRAGLPAARTPRRPSQKTGACQGQSWLREMSSALLPLIVHVFHSTHRRPPVRSRSRANRRKQPTETRALLIELDLSWVRKLQSPSCSALRLLLTE